MKFANWLQHHWQSIVAGIPFIWLLVFFLAPFFIVLKISLADSLIALAATIAIALVSFHLLEQPINRFKRHVPYVVPRPAPSDETETTLTSA